MANGQLANGKPRDSSKDFRGDIKVNNNPPTKEQLEKVADLPVLDVNRKSYSFKSLYADNENGPRRVLMVFIRHFFCGNCQDYLRTLASSVPPCELSSLSPPTSIIVIGCGQPEVIPMYLKETECPFPIYADPTRKLYDMLGMTKTLQLGSKAPDYMQKSLFSMAVSSFMQELRSGRKIFSGGDYRQVGGEFLFSGGKVTFCKRMKNTRDHAEVPEVRKHLGLNRTVNGNRDEKKPAFARKRWSTSGLGSGIGRRLSSKRRSWAPSTSTGGRQEAKGSPSRNPLEELKEEETPSKGSATPEDALAKLEGKQQNTTDETKGSVVNKTVNSNTDSAANGITNEEKVADEAATHGSPAKSGVMNGNANGHVTA